MRTLAVFATALIALLAGQAAAETLNNDTVIALTKAKVGDAALIAKIDTLPCGYDLSTDQLARLKNAKVSSQVLAAMIRRCPVKQAPVATTEDTGGRRPGIYLRRHPDRESEMFRIEPAYVSAGGAGGNGSLLFPSKSKLSLPSSSAQTEASSNRPVFYFYFSSESRQRDGFGNAPSEGARDPSGFNLVKFRVRSNKRDIVVEKATMLGSVAGVDPKLVIAFSVSEVGEHAYRIEVNASLKAGQYAFIERLYGGGYRVYDFQVR